MDVPLATRDPIKEVFNTTELLEHILLRVSYDAASLNYSWYDMKTVLLSQRVSHKFRAVIQGSYRIRVKLWLEPGDREGNILQINPLVESNYQRRRIPHIAFVTLDTTSKPAPLAIIGTSQVAVVAPPTIESWRNMCLVQPHPKTCSYSTLKWEVWGHAAPEWKSKTRWKTMALKDCPTAGQLVDRHLRQEPIPNTHYEIDLINERYYREGQDITNEVKRRAQC